MHTINALLVLVPFFLLCLLVASYGVRNLEF